MIHRLESRHTLISATCIVSVRVRLKAVRVRIRLYTLLSLHTRPRVVSVLVIRIIQTKINRFLSGHSVSRVLGSCSRTSAWLQGVVEKYLFSLLSWL